MSRFGIVCRRRGQLRSEIDATFATVAQQGADTLLIAQNAFFGNVIDRLTALAARYKLPTMYPQREFAEAGGLVSYGADFADEYRQAGLYVARILKGIKPADLHVVAAGERHHFSEYAATLCRQPQDTHSARHQ